MADDMRPAGAPDYATFLVEDVILSLGNLRGSLDWLAAEPAAERRAAAPERIERQMDQIEDRARELIRRQAEAAVPAADSKLWVVRGPAFRSRRRAAV